MRTALLHPPGGGDSRREQIRGRVGRWAFVLLLVAECAFAGSLRVRHLTPAEGLPNGRTWATTQDVDGFVWIASSSGVTRFDGLRFRTITVGEGLPHNTVLSVEAHQTSGVWVGTARGLAHLVGDEVQLVLSEKDGLGSEVIRSLRRVERRLWIGTEDGVYHYEEGGSLIPVRTEDGSAVRVRSMFRRSEGGVWVGTTTGVWEVLDGGLRLVEGPDRLKAASVFGVLETGGALWVGSSDGLFRRDERGRWVRFGREDGLRSDGVNRIVERPDGALWIGTWGSGLIVRDSDGFRPFSREEGFPSSFITDLHVDTEGNLWATSYQSGVVVMVDHAFDVLGAEKGIPPLVTRIRQGRSGDVWLGSLGGLVVLPGGDETEARVVELPNGDVVNLVLDEASRPWIASRSGVAVVVGDDVRWFGMEELGGTEIEDLAVWRDRCFIMTDRNLVLASVAGVEARLEESPVGDNVFTSRASEDGTLWMASFRGVGKWKPGEDARLFDATTGLPGTEVRSLWVGDGEVWAGTHRGLARMTADGEVLGRWTEEDGLPDNHVSQLKIASSGDVWVGTERGAAVLRGGSLLAFPTGPSFIGSQVLVFAEDEDGSLWVGTDLGLNHCRGEVCEPWGANRAMEQQPVYQVLRTSPEALWIVTSMGVHFWDGEDLAFFPCRGDLGVHSLTRLSAITDSRGRLWVGSDSGVVRFDAPSTEVDSDLPLHLRGLVLDGRPVDRSVLELPLPPETASLGLDFVALSFRDPEHVRYEISWSGPGDREEVWRTWDRDFVVTGLRPGRHRVTIDAQDVSGNQARSPISLVFEIAMPLWQRLWFQVSVVLGLVLGMAVVVRWRTKSFIHRQARLESLVRERTAALDEANAKLARLATHDELTGLPNHRSFWERARQMRAGARRRGESFALIILDLDDFKAVNDRWGHQAGDEVLRRAGEVLRDQVRDEDLVARYGGEEFAALLVDGDLEVACTVAERMRNSLAAAVLGQGAHAEIRITGSFGVATWRVDADSLRSLFRRADVAVYRAKSEGKDRVVREAEDDGEVVLDGGPDNDVTDETFSRIPFRPVDG